MKSERLYYGDSHLYDFTAQVTEIKPHNTANLYAVMLNRTAFYPTGGGQPHDTGMIENLPVVDCLNADETLSNTATETDAQSLSNEVTPLSDEVIHIVKATDSEIEQLKQMTNVRCRIDRARRLDHLQQHTAQHILSRAFLQLYNAPTHGFRLLPTYAEVDIKLDDASDERIRAALDLANEIVWENRPLKIHYMTAAEAGARGVRQRFERAGVLRVIEIEGFDFNPCGGTHAKQTGEVGMIFVPVWERAKNLARLTFVAGRRAFADYASANRAARESAKLLSCGRDEICEAVRRAQDENKSLQRRTRALEELAAEAEAATIISNTNPQSNGTRIITRLYQSTDKDLAALRTLAHNLAKHPQVIALLATVERGNARFVFARAADLTLDMNQLMRDLCAKLEGKGGGTSELAQGGGKAVNNLEQLIQECAIR